MRRQRQDPSLLSLEEAILWTVAYADLFDYPLTFQEAHRYLVGVQASLSMVQDAVEEGLLAEGRLVRQRGYLALPGRESIVETRRRREAASARMWRLGMLFGTAIASLPFVRMVAVTGALAVDNVEEKEADVDYLIVTASNRVWLARSLAIGIVYLARLARVTICPNYVMSIDALEQGDHSLFTAHELAQMVPIYGPRMYERLLTTNNWMRQYLPNASSAERRVPQCRVSLVIRTLKHVAETALAGKLGDYWEERERRVKIERLRKQAERSGARGVTFSGEQCKGHMDDHGRRTKEAYAQRLRELDLDVAHSGIL
jgi:hypothetical protein